MPLFRLSSQIDFPPAWLARTDGLLCIGGDLNPERLILAYQNGIFPWFSENEPLLWWSPDPRLIILPKEIYVSKSLRKTLRRDPFTITFDRAFEQVITACAQPRREEDNGTWLVPEMIEAYIELHRMGVAHSVETWHGDELVGGLYGLSLGRSFFGESMFSSMADASKVALVTLARHLEAHDYDMIDCQVTSPHLLRMGAREIPRQSFLDMLERSIHRETAPHVWPHSQRPKGDRNETCRSRITES